MRIVVDVPLDKETFVLALMQELGYDAHVEEPSSLDAIEEAHIAEILERRNDPYLSQTVPWADIRAKYVG